MTCTTIKDWEIGILGKDNDKVAMVECSTEFTTIPDEGVKKKKD